MAIWISVPPSPRWMVMMSDGEALRTRNRVRVLVAVNVSVVSSTLVPLHSSGKLSPLLR
ncbi:hypothetical protein [Streptomyces ipomoeae]|uniref:hypothetical protein n=1 Tax=Streptomyces ipomoeae TaxID=103232 RepID=UPI0035A574FC